MLSIFLTIWSILGCSAQPGRTVFEPVRFADGKAVLQEETFGLSEGGKGGKDGNSDRLTQRDSVRRARAFQAWDEGSLTVDYSQRIVLGDEPVAELLEMDDFLVERIVDEEDTLERVSHLSAFLRLELKGLPAGLPVERIDLIPTEGQWPERTTYSQKGWTVTEGTLSKALPGAVVPKDGSLVLWLATMPMDWSQAAFAAVVHASDGRIWSARLPGIDLQAGTAYRWTETCLTSEAPAANLKATPLPQTLLSIEPGEYSGITYVSGSRYAVVDDNLKGGGIVLFSIPISSDGSVGTVSMKPADGTTKATGKARDCEGIAYVPSTGTLYVSTEKQEIRAYDLSGRETGHALKVPGDLKNIESNRGFEALTYNTATGLFWTTTEAPLKADTFLPRLLRLQSFNSEGEPAGRYFYQTGEATRTSAGTTAYVFGIPALTALDDGRLLVLEREVYVPKGGFWDKLTESFTKTDLYLVDPVHDTAGILRKFLLCSFRTGALDLANFEGMCLGPTLPDGRRCLILIADSQKGSGGLTGEYVKVILLR